MKVTLQDIQSAEKVIQNIVVKTPCSYSFSTSELIGTNVFLKLENNQRTGSFKLRGAANKIASLSDAEKKRGVIACSAGNHAQGVALSSKMNGVKSYVVMPETASLSKIQATKNYGAEVILYGQMFDESRDHAYALAKENGYVFVHPFEDEKVIAGQGTMALEILDQVKDLDSIIVPVGGGGLISGVAVAVKTLNPKIKIIGVQVDVVSTMQQLFSTHQFEPVTQIISTLADGIAIKNPSQVMYESFIKHYVDEMVTVSDAQIAEAIVFLMERVKTIAEGSGAVSLAAAMTYKKSLPLGKRTCLLVCGGNIDMNIVAQVIQRGQIERGRLCELSVVAPDVPGSLSKLTQVFADQRANVLEVHHDRIRSGLNLKETRIDFVIETTSHQHIESIRNAMIKLGARIIKN
ncbi:MAG: threonine ammonia-lyase [Bdellovibrionales bacterium RIFCSPHIGHO2_01_FULL_40_29]|nr:MAG: threonine ammonia-lyase [Bdellovibrionales bacterium RIFCSPHIGHO2_01_FULL_40_29]OFZ33383.1 MAG: threonine ammonia-lyase [Bdellovibrionales bacterium RIFCSPHIGHO2_02_FULL_40_15]